MMNLGLQRETVGALAVLPYETDDSFARPELFGFGDAQSDRLDGCLRPIGHGQLLED